MKVVPIIQARLGSERFPGKVLADLGGRPMIDRVVDCVRRAWSGPVVVAIPRGDDRLATHLRRLQVCVFRGVELCVLDRMYRAARAWKAEAILRVNADCPMLNPAALRRDIQAVTGGFAYSAHALPNGVPALLTKRGVTAEAFTFDLLERQWKAIEHVSIAMYSGHTVNFNPIGFGDDCAVDTPEDLERVAELWQRQEVA